MRCAECSKWEMRPDAKEFGYCKAHAPQPTVLRLEDVEYAIVWPSTGKDDWCGEFNGIGDNSKP